MKGGPSFEMEVTEKTTLIPFKVKVVKGEHRATPILVDSENPGPFFTLTHNHFTLAPSLYSMFSTNVHVWI